MNLTNEELELFNILMDVVKTKSPQTTVYVVGGWVRDKLLGKKPKDIDLMIETMSGEDFASLVSQYVGSKDPHVIRSNPDKSKHVQTARAKIPLPSGSVLEVDFARARTEVYQPGSRVPSEIRPATAKEDASRRDLTVNALFYNINTGSIEDFTGQGLFDLKNRILRAPGVPKERLLEDPLRVMRIARFSGKLGWDIEPDTKAAMGDTEVVNKMLLMTASERIGEEITGLAMSSNPAKGFQALKEAGVLDAILNRSLVSSEYNQNMADWDMDQNNTHHDMVLWDHTIEAVKNISNKYADGTPEKAMAVLSALLHDTGKRYWNSQQKKPTGETSYHGHEDHSSSIAKAFLESLHLNSLAKKVCPIIEFHMRPHNLSGSGEKPIRKLLRELSDQGVNWEDLMNMAVSDAGARKSGLPEEEKAKYDDLSGKIKQVQIDMTNRNIDPRGCILNGNEIMQALGRKDSGDWIRKAKEWLKDLQDSNPSLTKDEAILRLKENFSSQIQSKNPLMASVLKGNISKTLLDEKERQIFELVGKRPVEAVSIAVDLWRTAPDDDRAVKLWLKSIMMANSAGGKNLATNAALMISSKLMKKDPCDPEAMALYLSCKTLMGESLSDSDKEILERANHIDSRITKSITGDLVLKSCSKNRTVKMANEEKFGNDPEELAALAESISIHVSEMGNDLPKNVVMAVESIPSRFYITRKMSKTEIGWLRDKLRQLWKFLTGKDISDFKTTPSPMSAKEYDGNFWLLPGGVYVHAFNHYTAAKKHKGVLCALLDINGFIFEKKLAERPESVIEFLIRKGAARVHIDRDKNQVIAQCSEQAWPWVREKLRRMVHKKKVVRVLDPSKEYTGWKSGIPIRIA